MKLIRFLFSFILNRIIPKNTNKVFGDYIYKLLIYHEALHPCLPPVLFIPGIQPATRFFGKTLSADRENAIDAINASALA
jgi:hypothetical protein